tara:strand:+ start:15 stop:323 length:309 start_codon:yes stop_codon:yes gene_type:complete
MIEAKKPLKAKLAGELAAAADESERKEIKAEFEARERALEHDIDHTPRELSMVRRAPELNPCRDRVSHPCLSRAGPRRQVQLPLQVEGWPRCVGTFKRKKVR